MQFQHCCFISYRHMEGSLGRTTTKNMVTALKDELEFLVSPQKVYLDVERLDGGDHYNEALASAICKSVCMVVLYWPTYFDATHLFCAREFKAMEELEQARLRLLPPEERVHGLIIILAVRGYDLIPEAIKKLRDCRDFEGHALNGSWKNSGFKRDIAAVGRYIKGRCEAFQSLPAEAFAGCAAFRLPEEIDVQPWVYDVASLRSPFPNREKPE
jgi:hypothetical protein